MTSQNGCPPSGPRIEAPFRALLITVTMFLTASAGAAQPACTFTQITDSVGVVGSERRGLSGDGNRVAFRSERDLTGQNGDGSTEIFLYDHLDSTLTQITDTTGGSGGKPALDGDGSRVAWASTADLLGSNADGNAEVFLYDTVDGTLLQLTDSIGGSTREVAIDAAGERIVFVSDRDPLGTNADGNAELFLFDFVSATLAQITDTTGGLLTEPAISVGGTRLSFVSDRDLAGGNPGGALATFLLDLPTMNVTQVAVPGGGRADFPVLGGGTRLAFESDGDPTGGNADGSIEIFFYEPFSDTFTQVTASATDDSCAPSIGRGGTRLAFESDGDPTGGNADGNVEIFLYDTLDQAFLQVTDTAGGTNSEPSLSHDGSRIVFRSSRDLTGGNADGNFEIFLAHCAPAPAIALPYDPTLGSLPSAQRWQHFVDDPLPDDGLDESNYALADGALVQADTGGASADHFNRQLYHRALDTPFDFTGDRVTASIEVQIIESTLSTGPLPANRRAGFGVQLTDARGVSVWLYIGGTGVFLLGENDQWTGFLPFDTRDEFHRYTLRVDRDGAFLEVDEVAFASLSLGQLRTISSGFSSLLFGDLTIGERSSSRVRAVQVSSKLIFADGFESGETSAWSNGLP